MQQSCPINFQTFDNTLSRISSLTIALLVAFYLYSGFVVVIFFVMIDLLLRVFVDKRFSPVYYLSLSVKRLFGLKSVMKDSASKRLATYFGLLFSSLLIGFHFLHFQEALYATAAVYILCLLLDSFFDFCLGCKIYYVIKKIYPNFME